MFECIMCCEEVHSILGEKSKTLIIKDKEYQTKIKVIAKFFLNSWKKQSKPNSTKQNNPKEITDNYKHKM